MIVDANENSELTDETESYSIGHLQHKLQIISVKLLQKDIELKNHQMKAIAKEGFLKDELEKQMNLVIQQSPHHAKLFDTQKAAITEALQLRRILLTHKIFADINSSAKPPMDAFIIGRNDYDLVRDLSTERLSLLDLLKLRVFECVLSLSIDNISLKNEVTENQQSVETIMRSVAVQTLANSKDVNTLHVDSLPALVITAAENNTDFSSVERQLQLMKKDNAYLCKQIGIQSEKLELMERQNREINAELGIAQTECADARARAMSAEKMQEILRDQMTSQKRDSTAGFNAFPTALMERLVEASSRHYDTDKEEVGRLRRELETNRSERDALRSKLECITQQREKEQVWALPRLPDPSSHDATAFITKSRLLSLEMQLSAACAARNDAQNQVEKMIAKLEATSKAYYELDAEKKVLLARTEAKLQVAVERLNVYEKMESDLDKVVEATAERIYADDDDDCEVRQVVELWTNPSAGPPLLPSTLATRRLEHCLELAKRLAASDRKCHELSAKTKDLQDQLLKVQKESKRNSQLLENLDKPVGCLSAALVSRDNQITDLQQERHKLHAKLQRLYAYTKDIVGERNHMVMDMERLLKQQLNKPQREPKSSDGICFHKEEPSDVHEDNSVTIKNGIRRITAKQRSFE